MTCACGNDMLESGSNGYRICINCDVLQVQELEVDGRDNPKGRVPTIADGRFSLEWRRRMREFYPEQFKKGLQKPDLTLAPTGIRY
jgi:hypothetical protein